MADKLGMERLDDPHFISEGAAPGMQRRSYGLQHEAKVEEALAPSDKVAVPESRVPVAAPAGPQPKKSRKRLILTGVLVLAAGLGGWQGYRWFTEGRFIVSTDDAYVKADTSVIAAKVSGYVSAVAITDNSKVKAGDLLARIDDGDYKLAVDAARGKVDTQDAMIARITTQAEAQKSSIDQAKAQLAAARADVVRTASELQRVMKLMQTSFGTQQRLEQAQADRDRAAAAVDQAVAAVNAAQANLVVVEAQKREAEQTRAELQTALDRALRDLSFTEIRAPFDGVVGNRAVQLGQYVQPGTRLLALVPLDSVYVEANFKETQLGRLKPGQLVTVKVDAFSDQTIEGAVESFSPASGAQFSLLPPENATGNFTKIVQRVPVRIKVPAEIAREGLLRPGLSVVVDVRTREAAPTSILAGNPVKPAAPERDAGAHNS
jgi:membrane fusion protein (multidrug efflux system)